MEEFMKTVLQNQGLMLQIMSAFVSDKEKREEIYKYGTQLNQFEPEQQDEQSGD